jgi:hypothetical protein
MILMLTRKDLVNLVRGCSPPVEVFDHPLVKPHYEYCDHPQRQYWTGLEQMTEAELWTLYLICVPRT